MDTSPQATADRLRRVYACTSNDAVCQVYGVEKWEAGQWWREQDERALARQYMADQRAGDNDHKPLTAEWLTANGWEQYSHRPHDRRWKKVVCVDPHDYGIGTTTHWLDIREPVDDGAGNMLWPVNFWQQHESDEKPDGVGLLTWVRRTTCGHVRRLAAVLMGDVVEVDGKPFATDDREPVTREWLVSLGVYGNDAGTEFETVVDVGDGRTEIRGTDDEEITHLGYSFADGTAYIDVTLGSAQKEIILLGPKTRGEMRALFRGLKTWDGLRTPAEVAESKEQSRREFDRVFPEMARLLAPRESKP